MASKFPNFLKDELEYAKAEAFWKSLWSEIPEFNRLSGGWHSEWFKPSPPKDGNPIFTAISEKNGKAIRVIQYEATTDGLEIEFWMDTYGGSCIEPVAIRELVIACAVSGESARRSFELMSSWVQGDIEFSGNTPDNGGLSNIRAATPRWKLPVGNPDSQVQ